MSNTHANLKLDFFASLQPFFIVYIWVPVWNMCGSFVSEIYNIFNGFDTNFPLKVEWIKNLRYIDIGFSCKRREKKYSFLLFCKILI